MPQQNIFQMKETVTFTQTLANRCKGEDEISEYSRSFCNVWLGFEVVYIGE